MYSNGKFVNNCKSVGPMRIRQHSLSPSRWPTPHLSFSFLFFFSPLFFIFRFLLISLHHISSFSLKENHKPKHQTQFSSSKKIQHHRLEKQKSIFLHLSLPLFFFFFLLFFFFFFLFLGLDDSFTGNFSEFGFAHNGQRPVYFILFFGFGWQLQYQFFWVFSFASFFSRQLACQPQLYSN